MLSVAGILSCSKDDNSDPTPNFDRTALVENIGSNIVVPGYQALSGSVNALDDAITAFNTNPSTDKLDAAQLRFTIAYKAWQHCAPFTFGPADQALLGKSVNIFPTNVTKINANISSGSYNLALLSNLDAKGFPALDYLLSGSGDTDAAILVMYTTDSNADKRKQYLSALSADLRTQCTNVLNAWLPTGGNYIHTFLQATGTDVGSAVGQLVNGMAYDLDMMKNYKVAIPVGIMPGSSASGTPLPDEVEGYYAGISAALLREELTTLQDLYLGRSSSGDNTGFDEYLVQTGAQYNGGSLNDAIKSQFTAAFARLDAVSDPLSSDISTHPGDVKALYTELQKLLVLMKTDMPSSLGILITFEDNDGD
jgi:predicted lipoprotein